MDLEVDLDGDFGGSGSGYGGLGMGCLGGCGGSLDMCRWTLVDVFTNSFYGFWFGRFIYLNDEYDC